jgi:putative acetyltransferase
MIYRKIEPCDNKQIAKIIRDNLEKAHLNIPGTAYFDLELDRLSDFYNATPDKRAYFVVLGDDGEVVGGVGIAEFDGIDNCAELQKLYLSDTVKGRGYGKELMHIAEENAKALGYKELYLETHSCLKAAVGLYEKRGFEKIDKPGGSVHSTMNLFYLKRL